MIDGKFKFERINRKLKSQMINWKIKFGNDKSESQNLEMINWKIKIGKSKFGKSKFGNDKLEN